MEKQKKLISLFLIFSMILLLTSTVFASDKLTATTTDDLGNKYDWEYELNDNGEIINLVCKNTDKTSIKGDIQIPSKIDGKPVVSLGYEAFKGQKNITGLTLSNVLKELGIWAFRDCTSLTKIDFRSVEKIGEAAFLGCTSLKEVVIPATVKDGAAGKIFPKEVTQITLSDGMTVIPTYLCAGTGITEIKIPDTVKEIGLWAFKDCEYLSKVDLGKIERIGEAAFSGCLSLKEIVIPSTLNNGAAGKIFPKELEKITLSDGMTVIPTYLCAGTGITEITVPNTVTEIDLWAFSNCANLNKITILDNVTKMDDMGLIFKNHNEDLTIYCYKDSRAQQYAVDHNIKYVLIEKKADNTEDKTNTENNDAKKSNTNVTNPNGTTPNSTTSNGSTSSKKDGSTTKSELPKAGKSVAIVGTIILVVLLGIAGFARYYKYRDVK